ncbi:MAG TPA: AIM24 family protein [Bacteroidales bacterium]|nr:AIM24 family protein [Bacteroidales bacterium]
MPFCSNCGTSLKEGAVFCHECGTRNPAPGAAFAATPAPAPPQPIYQQPVAPPPPQPQAPPPQPQTQMGPINYEIVEKETLKFLKAELSNSAIRYESGGMYYMQGNLEMEANLPSAGGFLKSMVTREAAVKPVIRGTGTVWFEPTFGNFTIMELKGDEWILDKGAYYASEMGIEIGSFTNKSMSGLFSGEGFFQTKVNGYGKLVILSNGPLETIELNNGKLVVDGSIAVARQASVQLTVAKASKGIFGSMISGEGIVNTFTGTGKVLIAPAANRYITLINYLSSIHRRVMQLKNS